MNTDIASLSFSRKKKQPLRPNITDLNFSIDRDICLSNQIIQQSHKKNSRNSKIIKGYGNQTVMQRGSLSNVLDLSPRMP